MEVKYYDQQFEDVLIVIQGLFDLGGMVCRILREFLVVVLVMGDEMESMLGYVFQLCQWLGLIWGIGIFRCGFKNSLDLYKQNLNMWNRMVKFVIEGLKFYYNKK